MQGDQCWRESAVQFVECGKMCIVYLVARSVAATGRARETLVFVEGCKRCDCDAETEGGWSAADATAADATAAAAAAVRAQILYTRQRTTKRKRKQCDVASEKCMDVCAVSKLAP